MADFAEAH